MRIYVDIDSSRIVISPGTNTSPTALEFKRGASSSIEVIFYSGSTQTNLADGSTGELGLKEQDKYDGDFVVSDPSWSMIEDAEGARSYFFAPDFNTAPLNTLLGHDGAGGDTSDDIPYVDLMFELNWTANGQLGKTNTITARVHNDVIKSGEGIPTSGNPTFPTAQELVDHLGDESNPHSVTKAQVGLPDVDNTSDANKQVSTAAQTLHDAHSSDISALEAKEWEVVTTNSLTATALPLDWPSGVVTLCRADNEASWPSPWGHVTTDRRLGHNDNIHQIYRLASSGAVYRRNSVGNTWLAWQEVVQSDGSPVNGDLTLAGVAKTTGNDLTHPDQIVNVGQADQRYFQLFPLYSGSAISGGTDWTLDLEFSDVIRVVSGVFSGFFEITIWGAAASGVLAKGAYRVAGISDAGFLNLETTTTDLLDSSAAFTVAVSVVSSKLRLTITNVVGGTHTYYARVTTSLHEA